MKPVFKTFSYIDTFNPDGLSMKDQDFFIGVDFGDLPDTACEVKMFVKEGSIYVLESRVRSIRNDETLPYCIHVKK